MQSNGWMNVIQPNILGSIPLHVDDTLDSLDDRLNQRRIPPLRGNGNVIQIINGEMIKYYTSG